MPTNLIKFVVNWLLSPDEHTLKGIREEILSPGDCGLAFFGHPQMKALPALSYCKVSLIVWVIPNPNQMNVSWLLWVSVKLSGKMWPACQCWPISQNLNLCFSLVYPHYLDIHKPLDPLNLLILTSVVEADFWGMDKLTKNPFEIEHFYSDIMKID